MTNLYAVPETLRSAGVALKSAPVRLAHATWEPISDTEAFVEVTYPDNPNLYSMGRVHRARNGRRRDAAKAYAVVAAHGHGYVIGRFERA